MSIDDDLADDIDQVFFDDFAFNAIVTRDGVDVGLRVLRQAGITRVVNDRYVKSQYEMRCKLADSVTVGEAITLLDDEGQPVGVYEVGELLDRDAVSVLYQAKKTG